VQSLAIFANQSRILHRDQPASYQYFFRHIYHTLFIAVVTRKRTHPSIKCKLPSPLDCDEPFKQNRNIPGYRNKKGKKKKKEKKCYRKHFFYNLGCDVAGTMKRNKYSIHVT
jgi:hypothetical protein